MAIASVKQPIAKKAGRGAPPSKPYGKVAYADPGYLADKKERYPIDSKRVEAAWAYINQTQNSAKYTDAQLVAIKRRIAGAMKRHGHDIYSQQAKASMDKMKAQTARAKAGKNTNSNLQAEETAEPPAKKASEAALVTRLAAGRGKSPATSGKAASFKPGAEVAGA